MPAPIDPTQILLAHNHWANIGFLNAAKTLSHDQFHQRFDIGPGSVHDTLSHVLGAMHRWTRALNAQEMLTDPRFETPQRTPDQLIALAHSLNDDLCRVAAAHPTEESVTAPRNGIPLTFPRSVILTHVTTHGVHHRAQCANLFRRLGVTSIPPSSVIEWSRTLTPA
jgi:uncharacterized damage-inducible protein DinB